MIRLLTKHDEDALMQYLYKEIAYNIFPIGDVEAFGFDKEFQRIYGELDEEGNYLSILLRYKEHAIYYSHQARFNVKYVEIFNRDPFDFISGKASLMTLIKPYLTDFSESVMYFCEATKAKKTQTNEAIITVDNEAALAKLYDLLKTIKEFSYYKKSKEVFIADKLDAIQMGTILAYQVNEAFVSTATTTATTTKNAMIVSVATHSDFRKSGYATKLMEALMDYYINHLNKSLCLFYDNEEAGAIYHRLGFKTLGMWHVYERKHDETNRNK